MSRMARAASEHRAVLGEAEPAPLRVTLPGLLAIALVPTGGASGARLSDLR